jgi:inhibitor of KinA sporulation pathway (predicted exonuclease)
MYLAKTRIPRSKSFDILAWWKSNSSEYPTLSRMAQDVLAIQASTVASESAFSTGRKLISEFRTRLTPKTVEALICAQDWIRASSSPQFSMKAIDDYIEQIDQEE